jgi:hypothetical protein
MITVICHRLLSIPGRKERESWTSKEGEVSADYPGQKIGWAFPAASWGKPRNYRVATLANGIYVVKLYYHYLISFLLLPYLKFYHLCPKLNRDEESASRSCDAAN